MNDEISEILKPRLTQMRNQQLTNMLRCHICHNFYRFAHTLVDCGHTFCQLCLINYIKTYKGRSPAIKCPQCHAPVDGNYRRSIVKDVYKQQLVDLLVPQFAQNDRLIIQRMQVIFPQCDMSGLIDNFRYTTWSNSKNKEDLVPEECNKESIARLPQKIRDKFGLSFEQFSEKIKNQQSYQQLLESLKTNASSSQNEKQSKIIEIKARSQRDFKYIGINNQMKIGNINIAKLQRYLEKKALDRISQTEDVPPEWMNKYDDRLDAKIYLIMGGKILSPEDDIQKVLSNINQKTIFYSLTPL